VAWKQIDIILKLFIIFFLFGCDEHTDLAQIEAFQIECHNFKIDYDKVKPLKNTPRINKKLQECSEAGAWK
jgi:hypothetical protein